MANDDADARYKTLPDVRDGLTREERVVLYVLHEAQKERGDRNVPTTMLWGRGANIFTLALRSWLKCWRGWERVSDLHSNGA